MVWPSAGNYRSIDLFRHRSSSKPVRPASECEDSLTVSVSSTLQSEDSSQSKDSVRKLLHKSGSRLLSIFKLRGSRGVRSCQAVPVKNDEDNSQQIQHAENSGVTACEPSSHKGLHVVIPQSQERAPSMVPPTAFIGNSNDFKLRKQGEYGGNPAMLQVRRSHSSPGLTHRLSHRISMTFGHPTVVHRANLRRRPSICSFSVGPPQTSASVLQKLGDNTQDDSDPSSLEQGSSISRLSQSTNPTSEGSPILPSALKNLPLDSPIKEKAYRNKASLTMETSPFSSASIVTVEATTSAKVFFETYFNEMFAGDSPRVRRRRELEERLYSLPLTAEERQNAREAWHRQESDYLRTGRALKARSASVKHKDNVSIAGYEIVKALGRGSFGVVRLVKEKGSAESADAKRASARGSKSIDALKSAVLEGTRSSRRRDLERMRKGVFAMKVIRKTEMLRNCQEGHLRAERDFLVASHKSRWIIPLVASFQDTHNLYLVMEYMVGGDFLSLLMRKNILSEEVTRWYIAEMVLCVEEAHRLRWIHRDVKPDNFLISSSGHLKISDFGLAFDGHWSHDQSYFDNHRRSLLTKLGIHVEGDQKDKDIAAERAAKRAEGGQSSKTGGLAIPEAREPGRDEDILRWRNRKERRKLARSIVGTSQYMAPEVVNGHPYDGRCDWWSIGIILYECLFGFTPFAAMTRDETKKRIENHHKALFFPSDRPSDRIVSVDAIDLIGQILQAKEYRLCSRKYMLNDYIHSKRIPGELLNRTADKDSKNYQGYYVYPDDAADIKDHPFFRNIPWEDMHIRKPPFVPKVKSWDDTKYFDDESLIVVEPSSDKSAPVEAIAKDIVVDNAADADNAKSQNSGPKDGVLKHLSNNVQKKSKSQRKKEKRRPRDKILRDNSMGKTALDMRKQGAFLGYTYRRPKDVLAALELERGRQLVAPMDRSDYSGRYS